MSFRLAVSAEMVFVDLPFEERVRRISYAGFEVEIWDWTKKDVDALVRTGATFSSMTGYVTGTSPTPTAPPSCCAPPRSRSRSPSSSTARGSTCTAPASTTRACPSWRARS